jgi:signal transduction histidine kinase
MKYLIIIGFVLGHLLARASNDVWVLNEKNLNSCINKSLKIAEEPTGLLTLDEMLKNTEAFKYPENNPYLHFGLSNDTYWVKAKLLNNTQQTQFVLFIDDPSLGQVEFYMLDSQGRKMNYAKTGTQVVFSQRTFKSSQIAFQFDLPVGEFCQIFLKIKTKSFITIPVYIKDTKIFQEQSLHTHFFLGGFYGLMVLVILYNLLAFLISKEKLLLYFTLSALFFTCTVGTYDGMLATYLPWLHQALNYAPEAFLMSIALALSVIFARMFLNVPNKSQLSYILKVLAGFYFLNTFVSWFNPFLGINVLIGVFPIYLMMAIWGFIWAYKQKVAMARYLMMANLFLVIGAAISLLAMFGNIESPWWNNYGLHIGYVLHIFTISLGITSKLNRMRLEVAQKENQILKEKAKKEFEREKNIELEKIVQERTQKLTQQNEELVKLNAELDRFVYSISHELSSPLKSLIGLIQLMKQDANPESLAIYLEMQEKSIYKLDLYTRELTDLLRNARIDIQKQPIYFRELLNEVLNQRKSDVGYDKVKKIISIKQDVPFASDKNRLAVLLGNLISNSIQYYRAGIQSHLKVQIEVNTEKALITVSDNGQGIGREHLDKVFQMFYRASERSQGSGLGLYIVKETINKLNGKIDMHSEANVGTIFKIEIPNLFEKSPSNETV